MFVHSYLLGFKVKKISGRQECGVNNEYGNLE